MTETETPTGELGELAELSPIDYLKELTTPEGFRIIRNSNYSVLIIRYDPGSDWPSEAPSYVDIYAYNSETFLDFNYGDQYTIEENSSEIEKVSTGRDEKRIVPQGSVSVKGLALWVQEQALEEIREATKGFGHFKKGKINPS